MNYSRQTYKRGGGDPSLFLGIFYVENAKLKVAKKMYLQFRPDLLEINVVQLSLFAQKYPSLNSSP